MSKAEAPGIDVTMVTVDILAIASEISNKLGLGTNIEVAKALFKADAVGDLPQARPRRAHDAVRDA
ncbi:MAG TPA: hypothetical protein VNF69_14695 [Burkholderiales bacterium]|nr:hypothetical protein [Burkholderiales bacterium]